MKLIVQKFFILRDWRIYWMVLLFAFLQNNSWCQSGDPRNLTLDTTRNQTAQEELILTDSLTERRGLLNISPDTLEHSPRKAMIYSFVLPGLGQVYNKKYFKIPFVYGILGGVGYWIHYNTQGYRGAVDDYEIDPSSINERYLRAWRRRLEISYMTMAGAYALQVLDAYVDAYLFYWEVNPDLSLRVAPSSLNAPVLNYGLTCSLTF